MVIDYSLYLVTDTSFLNGITLEQAVEQSILGGVTVVQLREKELGSRDFYQQALKVKEITSNYGVPLIINDRVDIALAVEADGIHVGQSDLPLSVVRKLAGDNMIIGISVNTLQEAEEAEKGGADYIGIGPVFYTDTKKDLHPLMGFEGLMEITKFTKLPSVAIGGIGRHNTVEIMNCGVDGIAVVSAILGQEDIVESSKELKKLIQQCK